MEMQMYVRSCLERRRNYQDTRAYLTLNGPRFVAASLHKRAGRRFQQQNERKH